MPLSSNQKDKIRELIQEELNALNAELSDDDCDEVDINEQIEELHQIQSNLVSEPAYVG